MNNFNNLPAELRDNGLFCLWKREVHGGRVTKIPYKTNGYRAKSTVKADFTDFETAMRCVKNYNGIGLGIFDGFCAVDIDHCVKDGVLSDLAQEIVNTFNSYTEYSPSGEGVRIIFKAQGFKYDKKRYYINNHKLGLEIYVSGCTSKYVTLTGNVIKNLPVRDCSTELSLVLDYYMKKRKDTKADSKMQNTTSYLSDEEVITKALNAKNGEKFKRLWSGDFDSSHSEADLALCSHLAFWCDGDTEQMDRLFRSSSLYREKWERDDYREQTLKTAVRGCREFYSPNPRLSLYDDFCDDIISKLKELKPEENPRFPQTDIGGGRLFADCYKDKLRYVMERKCFYYYKGGVWIQDMGNLYAMECVKELADALLVYTSTIKDRMKKSLFLEFAVKWQKRHSREVFLKDAQSVYPVSLSDFDSDPYIFNCKNGTLHLDTLEFTEHKPSDKLTKISEVTYNPDARCSRFADFVNEICQGDKDKAKFLQKALGYSLSGDTKHECLFILYGATTRNGKGTLCESVLKVLGDYGITSRPETISLKINQSSTAPSEDIARLSGVRFVNISEPGKGLTLDAAKLKSMTGNDTINARFLHENSFDYKPQFKLYINTNYLPVVNDMTLFSSGRIITVPFERHFEEHEQDKTLKTEFAKEESQSAILNWLIDGYKMQRDEGLKLPESVQKATDSYTWHRSAITKILTKLIKENAVQAQNQEDYLQKYESLAQRHDKLKSRYEILQQKRERRLYQADTLSAFMFALSELNILNLKWTPTLWHTTVYKVIVNVDGSVVFHFKNGSDVEV